MAKITIALETDEVCTPIAIAESIINMYMASTYRCEDDEFRRHQLQSLEEMAGYLNNYISCRKQNGDF